VTLAATALVMLFGGAVLIEMLYRLQLSGGMNPILSVLGVALDVRSFGSWLGALAVALVGFAAFEFTRRRFARAWGAVQGEIEALSAPREAA
jgi:branched-chain amino acid transport system permease protein